MGFFAKLKSNTYISTGVDGALAIYGWATEHLWPIYSAGAVLSAVFMLVVAQEKQILGDHLHGSPRAVQLRGTGKREETIQRAQKLLDEEASIAIKQDVWALPKAEFEREYNASHADY